MSGRKLTREHLRERGAVRKVWMQNLCQLGMRDAELPAPDRCRTSDGGVLYRVTKALSADHSRRAHDYKGLLAC
jgi:hypothetical protein